MAHIIRPVFNLNIIDTIKLLTKTHSLIVSSANIHQIKIRDVDSLAWGASMKRLEITLPIDEYLIGKKSEKYTEIINILATVERTISSLIWFSKVYPETTIKECHPSTSDTNEGNDIVLIDKNGKVIVRCEVTDIVSGKASQNGKENKDLKNLGCDKLVPNDTVYRYISTSFEFSNALSSSNRKWDNKNFHYIRHETGFSDQTVLLEIRRKA